jgi:hypothetical protein
MVYLIHFSQPYKHARHYVGWTQNGHTLRSRLKSHRAGNGARLMEVVTKAGIDWEVVRTWKGEEGDRNFERKLKRQKHSWRHCPVCREEIRSKRAAGKQENLNELLM